MFPFDRRPAASIKSRTGLNLALVAGVLGAVAFVPVHAESRQAQGDARTASASVDFRIVIPETVRFIESREQQARTRQFTSRSIERVDGREITTVARP